jgi:hypothetical protein
VEDGRTVVDKRDDKEDTVCCAKRREGTMKEQGVLGLKRLGKTFLDLSLSLSFLSCLLSFFLLYPGYLSVLLLGLEPM